METERGSLQHLHSELVTPVQAMQREKLPARVKRMEQLRQPRQMEKLQRLHSELVTPVPAMQLEKLPARVKRAPSRELQRLHS